MGRKRYTEEFKREAVRLAASSGNLSATARELGVSAHVRSVGCVPDLLAAPARHTHER